MVQVSVPNFPFNLCSLLSLYKYEAPGYLFQATNNAAWALGGRTLGTLFERTSNIQNSKGLSSIKHGSPSFCHLDDGLAKLEDRACLDVCRCGVREDKVVKRAQLEKFIPTKVLCHFSACLFIVIDGEYIAEICTGQFVILQHGYNYVPT